jgi:hypothetical protein
MENAMTQAVPGNSADAPIPATGISVDLSRRAMLGGAALAGVLLATPALALPSADPDARFWPLHARWQHLEEAWDGDDGLAGGDDDAVWDAAAAEVSAAFDAMMLAPISTVAAVLAKFKACAGQEILLDDRSLTTLDAIERDLARLAAAEGRA